MINVRSRGWCLVLLAASGVLSQSGFAQDTRGTIQGRIADGSGAAVAGANITLQATNTGVITRQTSNAEGSYRFDYVDPGAYSLTVQANGFNTFIQGSFDVQAQGNITIDAALKVGDVRDTVTVEASPVAVDFNNAELKTTVDPELALNIARLDRNPFKLSLLNPAALETHTTEMNPFQSLSANSLDLGGQTNYRNDILVDGNPISMGQKASYTPNTDAIAEVNVSQNSVDAENGHSFGGAMQMITKAGTNDWHGSAFYIGRNPDLNAKADRTTAGSLSSRYNIWGGTLGNRILKNKLFNFASYEGWLWNQPSTISRTVPTALEQTGNFSQALNADGTARIIYNPYTTTLNPTTGAVTRMPFQGNIIPPSLIDPLAAKLMAGLPLPNNPGSDLSGSNNYSSTYSSNWNYYNWSDRVDYYVNDKLRIYGRASRYYTNQGQSGQWTTYPSYSPHGSLRGTSAFTGNAIYTLDSRTVIEVRGEYHTMQDDYGYAPYVRTASNFAALWPGQNWYQSVLSNVTQLDMYPQIESGTAANQFYSNSTVYLSHFHGSSYGAKISRQIGQHFMKAGVDLRYTSGTSVTYADSSFIFEAANTANTFLSPSRDSGNDLATFLLGALDNNSVVQNAPLETTNSNLYSAYLQDDYKLSKRISLNIGVRYEYEVPYFGPGNAESRGLDLSTPNAALQASPPVMPALVQQLTGQAPIYNGNWLFTSSSHPGVWNAQDFVFMPRVGLAYRVNDKTAVRVGWASYVQPTDMVPAEATAPGSTAPSVPSMLSPFVPFYTLTQNVGTPLQGIPQATISNPFPATNPIIPALQQNCGVNCGLGTSTVTIINQNYKRPVNDRFNVTLSRQLPSQILAEITYFGNFGHDYSYYQNLNQMNPQIGYTDKSEISQNVANPFYNYLTPAQFPGPLRNQPTVALSSLLVPYPQYGSIYEAWNSGVHERYDSIAIKIQRPFVHGFNFLAGYNYNYERQQQYFNALSQYDRQFSWIPGANPRQRLNIASVYQFPFGKGRAFLNNMNSVGEAVLGGWQTTVTWRYQSGDYLLFGPANVTCDPGLSNPTQYHWFNTSCVSVLPAFTNNTNPWLFGNVKGPNMIDVEANISKTFSITEKYKAEFKLAAYNLLNRLNLADPDTTVTDAAFGTSAHQGTQTLGRELEYSLRFHF